MTKDCTRLFTCYMEALVNCFGKHVPQMCLFVQKRKIVNKRNNKNKNMITKLNLYYSMSCSPGSYVHFTTSECKRKKMLKCAYL